MSRRLRRLFAAILSLTLGISAYAYPVGNRKQITSTLAPVPAGLWNYDANDRFTAGDTYDADGNTVSSGGIANVYDFENHLIQKGGVTIVYDGDGNRVSKTVAGVTTTYLVDTLNPTGYAQVVYESFSGSSSGNYELNHSYVYGLELISQTRSYVANFQSATQKIYYAYDGHGSVRALTNPTGAVTDTYDYDAFGNLIHSTGTTPNNYLFAGEQFDPDLNLYYNRARYLNTSTGRFWNMDTEEGESNDPLSLHKYLYAGGDPIDRLDPSGRDFLDTLGAAAISVGSLANQTAIVATTVLGSVYINLYRVPEVIETASSYLTVGLGAFETLRFLGTNVLNYTEKYSSIPVIRGGEFEEAAGANLDRWFPALDYYDKETGVAVQIRSTTQTSSPQALLAVVQRAVNRVNNLPPQLKGLDRNGLSLTIDRADIKAKGVLIGIPAKPLPWFGTFLQQVRQLSESEGVAVTVQFVEGLEGETIEK
jgi:RHS repeat-associated protein